MGFGLGIALLVIGLIFALAVNAHGGDTRTMSFKATSAQRPPAVKTADADSPCWSACSRSRPRSAGALTGPARWHLRDAGQRGLGVLRHVGGARGGGHGRGAVGPRRWRMKHAPPGVTVVPATTASVRAGYVRKEYGIAMLLPMCRIATATMVAM